MFGEVLIVLIVFAMPVAIVRSVFQYKLKKAALESGQGADGERRLLALEKQNNDLRERVETLESIVIEQDDRLTGRAAARALEELPLEQIAPAKRR